MTTLLRIDASARGARSLTHRLGDSFETAWLSRDPRATIIRRDVGRTPPPFITEAWIAAAFAKPDARTPEQAAMLRVSDGLIDELRRADVILIASPMYNYGMPAMLKAWFDQVVRIGQTFTFDLARGDRPLEPILSDKTLVLLTSWGEFGFGPGELNDGGDHLVPHVRFASRYLGVETFHHIGVEYQEFGDTRHEASKSAAFAAVPELVERLAHTADLEVAA